MKKSYKRMLIFQIFIFLIFILNSFVSNILSGYNFVIFLMISLVLFKFFFGFEKDRNRYIKDVIIEILIYLLTFFMLFYLFGVVSSFAKTGNYYNWYGLKTFIIPITFTIILKEILRYMMLKKCENSKVLITIIFFLFTFLDVTEAIYYNGFNSNFSIFIFVALSLLPAISENLVLNYISMNVGYKPIILYLIVTNLYAYLIPIIPNPNEYITAIIRLLLPVFLWIRIHTFFIREKDEHLDRNYGKSSLSSLIIPLVFTIIIIYFTSGYFHYFALVIASGSMESKISRGDVVIIKKIDKNYEKLRVGQILAYKYNNVVIVHRIVKIVSDNGQYYFYTKGDANSDIDNYEIPEKDVIGITNFKIPYIGLPTVWLNE